jgi:hypothetical protein
MKRKDEEFCRVAFSQHLQRQSFNKMAWREVPRSEEPPDYVLSIADRKFAVEITTLMEIEEIGGFRYPSEALDISLRRLCERLERDAKKTKILSGLYILGLEPIANLKIREPEIRQRVFDYMRRTKALNIGPCETLARDGINRIDIQKWGNHKSCLAPVTSRGEGTWEDEIRSAARQMLYEALEQKRWKLRKIQLPKILLLLDRYHCADSESWTDAARGINFDEFHAVARIWQDASTLVLHSDDDEWRLRAT